MVIRQVLSILFCFVTISTPPNDRAQRACRGAPDPSALQAASDFDPTSHADFGKATHPGVGGGTHRRRGTFERC